MKNLITFPSFSGSIIEEPKSDGYWIQTFHFDKADKVPGLIASGLVSGLVEFLENPLNADSSGEQADSNESGLWEKHAIAEFDSPVSVTAADITGDGLLDVIVCHDYGPIMLDCYPTGGWISWLKNPGRDNLHKGLWEERKIGRWPSMHRVVVGHFTQRSFLEVIGAPVVYGPHDKVTPIPILCYQTPHQPEQALEWSRSVVDDEHFTVIHEVVPRKLHGPKGLDSLLIATREGVNWLFFEDAKWKHESITIGEPRAPGQLPNSEGLGTGDHWGSGCCDIGKFGDDPFAYIPTIEAFHGGAVCVYTKTERGLLNTKWKRHVLDVYGTPTQLQKHGDGPGHFVICADFDGDGEDEFLVSMMGNLNRDDDGNVLETSPGPNPNKGIMYYKAIDLENGIFAKWNIAAESSARIALGDFCGKGRIDLASVSYNVVNYYEEPNPVVRMYSNELASSTTRPRKPTIIASIWGGEGIVYFPNPETIEEMVSMPLVDIANFAISVEIWPPGSTIPVEKDSGLKVLYGSLTDSVGTRHPLGGAEFPSIAAIGSKDSGLATDKIKGAMVLRLTPISCQKQAESGWSHASKVPVKTTFKASTSLLELPDQKFVKVEDLWWGKGFEGVEFYNLTGFHFRFLETKTNLAHIQFWVAGPGVDCGVHNHSDNIFQEIHVGLSLGTKTGGMSRVKDEYEDLPEEEIHNLPEDAYEHIAVPPLHEHGGLWYRDSYGKALRGKKNVVSYPWHKWQAGAADNVDVWMALEFNPDLEL